MILRSIGKDKWFIDTTINGKRTRRVFKCSVEDAERLADDIELARGVPNVDEIRSIVLDKVRKA